METRLDEETSTNQIILPQAERTIIFRNRENLLSRPNQEQDSFASCEVILLVDEFGEHRRALEFAIEMAKNFSARIVLAYVTTRTNVPDEYVEYARLERYRDYVWNYYASLGQEKLAGLGKQIERAGIEWSSFVHLGNMKDALESCKSNERAILVVLSPPKKNRISNMFSLGGLTVNQISKLGLPVLVL